MKDLIGKFHMQGIQWEIEIFIHKLEPSLKPNLNTKRIKEFVLLEVQKHFWIYTYNI